MKISNRLSNILRVKNIERVKELENLLNIKENLLTLTKYSDDLVDRDIYINKLNEIDNEIDDLADLIEEELNKRTIDADFEYHRGQIVLVALGHKNKMGSEQKGIRPCVIIQNNSGNKYSPNLIVSPLTTKDKKSIPTHVQLYKKNYKTLEKDCTILCEQVITISKDRCYKIIGKLSYEDVQKLNEALKVSILS